jgi:hypothetical protein
MIFVTTVVVCVESSSYYDIREGKKGTVISKYFDEGIGRNMLEVRDSITNFTSVSPENYWKKA